MTPRSLFAVIIKIIGIYLIINAATLIPQWVITIYDFGSSQFGKGSSQGFVEVTLFLLLTAGFYFIILRYCLFKTEWLIDKLHLDRGFSEEKIDINIHRSTVLKIAVIVIGAMIIVNYLPFLCEQVFEYFKMSARDTGFQENPASRGIVLDAARLFIGFFLVTASRLVVNFIERKRKGPALKTTETTEE